MIGEVALAGNGTLTTDGPRVRFGRATFTGTGSLTVDGTVEAGTVTPTPAGRGRVVWVDALGPRR